MKQKFKWARKNYMQAKEKTHMSREIIPIRRITMDDATLAPRNC